MASESNMAEGLRVMDSTVPAKRLRLDYPGEMLASEQKENFQYFIRTPDMLASGGRVSSTSSNSSVAMEGGSLTCDSGFNELTPPRLLEEEQQSQPTSATGSLSSHSPQPHGIKRSHASCIDEDDEETTPSARRSPVTSMSLSAQRNSFATSVTQSPSKSHCSNSPSPSRHFHTHHSPIAPDNPGDVNDGDDNSVSSDDSRVSRLSNGDAGGEGSDCGEEGTPEPAHWVQQQMRRGHNPRAVLSRVLGADPSDIPEHVSDEMIWRLLLNVLTDGPRRERLRHLNTMDDAVRLMRTSRRVIVLTGAGVSVSCGIPDFRSRDGIYARLAVDFPNLPDPQAMFDINFFRRDPRPFFKFAREIYPGQFTPSLCHRFLRCMESHNKLLRNYTQNIDTLEQVAGISNVIQCHGSFASATCQRCGFKVSAGVIKEDIFQQRIPMCPHCTPPSTPLLCYGSRDAIYSHHGSDTPTPPMHPSASPCASPASPQPGAASAESPRQSVSPAHNLDSTDSPTPNDDDDDSNLESFNLTSLCARNESNGVMMQSQPIMKPDIVFFGEGLPDEFHDSISEDQNQCDLLIVIGSSLKVRPVAHIPNSIPPHVPQILINREPLDHLTFDIELLGDCDVIVNELCHRLGPSWTNVCNSDVRLTEIRDLPPKTETPSSSPALARPTLGAGESDVAVTGAGAAAVADAPHPKDEDDIEALRACWAPKIRESVAARLPDNSYLYNGGHRYVFKGAEVFYDPDDDIEEDDDSQNQDDDDDDDDEEGELVDNDDDSSPVREVSSHSSNSELASGDACSMVASKKEYAASFNLQNVENTATGVSPPHSLDDVVEAVQAVEEADQLLYNSGDTVAHSDCARRTLSCDSSTSSNSCQLSTAATVTIETPSVQEMDSLLSGSEQEEDCVDSDWMTLHASLADTPSFDPEVAAPTLRSIEGCSRPESQTQFNEPSEPASKLNGKIESISRTSVAL